ncbi:hypothetical protein S2091_4453 [Solimicrobium silvestre]|uniref:Phage lysis regulatory protein, LysB family n=1 Tax=Solimicrobium silvestre TaxID=2099400 RepID=A0A2S9GT19_9BURK|nr:hypothetical protein S2091_4453 [Solimicrobium silvestre]
MGIVVKVLLSLLVVVLLGTTIILQRTSLIAEKQKNTTLTNEKAERDQTIKQLQAAEVSNKKRLAQLQTERNRISATLSERETFIENLHHDNPLIQSWADTPLPAAIVQLRQRPAATGASEYHSELSQPPPLHPASSQPNN